MAQIAQIKAENDEVSVQHDAMLIGYMANQSVIVDGGLMEKKSNVPVPDPPMYNRAYNAKEIDNFLWAMYLYFGATRTRQDRDKITIAVHYLGDIALLWWRTRCMKVGRGLARIEKWDEFKDELKRVFYPKHANELAMKRLWDLKHTGTVKEYAMKFQILMLELPDMTDNELLFYFMDGLQPQARQELHRRNVRSLEAALTELNNLSKNSEVYKDKAQRASLGHEGRNNTIEGSRSQGTSNAKKGLGNQGDELTVNQACFLCDKDDHSLRSCPRWSVFDAIYDKVYKSALK